MSILSQQKQSQAPDFPNVRPSLDLRFALAKKLDPRITFTRGSTGTYFGPDGLMRTAGVNEPRFDYDPVTGECEGLLIEESRQNLLTYSEQFDNVVWIKSSSSIQQNLITAPDGNTTADKIVENTSSSGHSIYYQITLPSTTSYTFSVFLKAGERTWVDVRGYNSTNGNQFLAKIDLINGVFLSNTSGTVRLDKYPNGWYRFSGVGSFNNIYTQFFIQSIIRNNNASDTSYSGDGTSGIYIWGAQLEAGAFPTSYIPTTTSTVTRSADTANITNISSFFNAGEGTLCVDSEMPYQTNLRFPSIGFTRSTSGSSNTIQFYYYNTSTPYAAFLVRNYADAAGGGTAAANLVEASGPSQTVGSYKKFIGTYKFGEFNYYFDGKYVNRRTTNKNLPSNLTYMEIGTNAGTVDRLNGHIRRITYYPIALTSTQLVNLTS